MLRIEVSTLVSRLVPEVWGYFIDLTNSARWTRSGSELRQTSDGALGVGATINSVDPATIEIGAPVQVVFDRVSDEFVLPRWVRA